MVQWYDVPALAAGASMVGLAVWVALVLPRSRLHATFALFLTVFGTWFVWEGLDAHLPLVRDSLVLAFPFAGAAFLCAFRERHVGVLIHGFVYWLLGLGAAVLLTAYWSNPALYSDPDGIFHRGPLWFLSAGPAVTMALLAIVVGRDAIQMREDRFRLPLLALSLAATVQILWMLPLTLLDLTSIGADDGLLTRDAPWAIRTVLDIGATLFVAAFVVGILVVSRFTRNPVLRHAGVWYALAAGVSVVGVLLASLLIPDTGDPLGDFFNTMGLASGLVALVFAPLAGYAILRERSIDADRRLKRFIGGGTVTGILVAVLFVASESAAVFLGDRLGTYIGIGVTGLLLVLVHPLVRLGGHVADGALPHAKPLGTMTHPERLALLQEQFAYAWMDGRLTPRERLRLDAMRERLGISRDDAADLEVAVLRREEGLPTTSDAAPRDF